MKRIIKKALAIGLPAAMLLSGCSGGSGGSTGGTGGNKNVEIPKSDIVKG